MNKTITGIILCGGRSSRMGSDKGLLKFNGVSLVKRQIQLLENLCEKILLITSNRQYEQFGKPIHEDLINGKGPSGGIYTALHYSNTEYILVLACDMPFVTIEFLNYLIEQSDDDYDAIVPVGGLQKNPLCAIYARSCETIFNKSIAENCLRMTDILDRIRTRYVHINSEHRFFTSQLFHNVNSPCDLV